MFCPLCYAEYRAGFSVCSTCHATLVAAEAPESERRPPRLRWETHDQREADRVFGKLFEAGVPCLEKAQAHFFSMSILSVPIGRRHPTIMLYVLERDASAARQAVGVEFVPDQPEIVIPEGTPLQDCPYCSVKFPAGQNFCPACGGDVLAWTPPSAQESAAQPGDSSGAPGEPGAGAPAAPYHSDDGEAKLVWRGDDPVTFSRALEALKEDGIRAHALSTSEHLAFEFAMPRPKHEIFVAHADEGRALSLVHEFQSPFPLVPLEPTSDGADDLEGTSGGAGTERSTAEPTSAGSREFVRRRAVLRWGAGLQILSSILFIRVVSTAPFYSLQFRFAIRDIQGAAMSVLLAGATLSAMTSIWFLYHSWAGKSDKIGMLSLLFGLQATVILLMLGLGFFA